MIEAGVELLKPIPLVRGTALIKAPIRLLQEVPIWSGVINYLRNTISDLTTIKTTTQPNHRYWGKGRGMQPMNICQAIVSHQRDWADNRNLTFDAMDLDANLISPMSAQVRSVFSKGQGNELASKMKAPHSSSALVYNFFEYWRDKSLSPLEQALTAECCEACAWTHFEFEQTFPTGLRGTPPHLDVILYGKNGKQLAVESKFTEPYCKSPAKPFQESYFPEELGLWGSQGLHGCQQLAEDLQNQVVSYSYLDAHQLLKHILGLAKGKHDFTLLYLWYEWPSAEATAHRVEISDFALRVRDEVSFCAVTYNALYAALSRNREADGAYLDYLYERYFHIP